MQSLRYSITLNEAQLDYLSDEQQDILRMKCLKTFIRDEVPQNLHPDGRPGGNQGLRKELFSCPTTRAIHGLQGRPCPAVGLQSEDGNPHRPRVQPAWHPPVRINQPNHHPHADLPVSLVHRLEIDKERFLRQ